MNVILGFLKSVFVDLAMKGISSLGEMFSVWMKEKKQNKENQENIKKVEEAKTDEEKNNAGRDLLNGKS